MSNYDEQRENDRKQIASIAEQWKQAKEQSSCMKRSLGQDAFTCCGSSCDMLQLRSDVNELNRLLAQKQKEVDELLLLISRGNA